MKFYLLQLGHSHSENTLHAFDTATERDAMTKELIYGTRGDLCPDDERGLGLYLEELREDGSVEFEGDPGLQWFTAEPAVREPKAKPYARECEGRTGDRFTHEETGVIVTVESQADGHVYYRSQQGDEGTDCQNTIEDWHRLVAKAMGSGKVTFMAGV